VTVCDQESSFSLANPVWSLPLVNNLLDTVYNTSAILNSAAVSSAAAGCVPYFSSNNTLPNGQVAAVYTNPCNTLGMYMNLWYTQFPVSYTMEWWFQMNHTGAYVGNSPMVALGVGFESSTMGLNIAITTYPGQPYATVTMATYLPNVTYTPSFVYNLGGSGIPVGWTHYALTYYDPLQQFILYVNGTTSMTPYNYTGPWLWDTAYSSMRLGGTSGALSPQGSYYLFQGWSYSKNASQITNDYVCNGPAGMGCNGCSATNPTSWTCSSCTAGYPMNTAQQCYVDPCGAGGLAGSACLGCSSTNTASWMCSSCASGYVMNNQQCVVCSGCFISTWNTTLAGVSNSSQVQLPLPSTGVYNALVSWGDGTTSMLTSYTQGLHNYTSPGVYTINITGLFQGFSFGGSGDPNKLLQISQFGSLSFANQGGYFWGCSNLIITASDILNLTGVTNMLHMFVGCSSLTTIPNVNSWNTSQVTNMGGMFQQATAFNQNIDSWNTSQVTNMQSMFQQATAFNQNIGSWNTNQVTNMVGMFQQATAFNQNIGSWNTNQVTNMQSMFQQATAFNQNIGSWNTNQVTNMVGMFQQATVFNQNIGSWNTNQVTNMVNMFYLATAFNQNIGSWNTSRVTTMQNMFKQAAAFNQDISNWDVRKVTTMSGMFTGVTLSTSVYNAILNGWWNNWGNALTSSVPFSAESSFYSCSPNPAAYSRGNLTSIDLWAITDAGCQ
jgi:surface protein